ncbi:hypothetical protein J6590_038448 [Homalodisca vitripennis]|nr:hypothetical protein J6590_038448 [Homalodisca vitripennis]
MCSSSRARRNGVGGVVERGGMALRRLIVYFIRQVQTWDRLVVSVISLTSDEVLEERGSIRIQPNLLLTTSVAQHALPVSRGLITLVRLVRPLGPDALASSVSSLSSKEIRGGCLEWWGLASTRSHRPLARARILSNIIRRRVHTVQDSKFDVLLNVLLSHTGFERSTISSDSKSDV